MDAQLGHKLNDKKAMKWTTVLTPSLLPGEQVLALVKCNNVRPHTEGIAVTNFRLGGVGLHGWSVEFPFIEPLTLQPDASKETLLVSTANQNAPAEDSPTRRPEMLFKMVQKEDHELLMTTYSVALTAFDSAAYMAADGQVTAKSIAESAQVEAAERGEWPAGTRVVGSSVSKKASLAIARQCHNPDEAPWLILGAGSSGVLAAWGDRLAIVKTGAVTSMFAGSLGGERTATFHFVDITGLEYNSGMINGVLEVLTPSYSGGRTKDFWSSGESDPFKQSNCLPLSKSEFSRVASDIAELRSRIAESKRPTIAQVGPPPPPGGIASQLREMADLHDAGVLTDEEFSAAKQRLLSGD